MNTSSVFANLPTKFGDFQIIIWNAEKGNEPIALVTKNLNPKKPVFVRIHSECITGDTFGSFTCDCGVQKDKALKMIHEDGNGIFIYLRQEGRGIGIFEKIKAMALQEQGYDTHEANILLGHEPDEREYSIAKNILHEFKIQQIRLITNNPSKVNELINFGFDVVTQFPLKVRRNKYNKRYIQIKETKFKHYNKINRYDYYLGITGFTNTLEIEKIAVIANKIIKDPLSKIAIGINATNKVLTNKNERKNIEDLVVEANKSGSHLTAVLHYSFKNSQEYKKEARKIVEFFPFIKTIQLNDVEKEHIILIQYLSNFYNIIFPLNNTNIFLLKKEKFTKLVKRKKITILLDDSKGRGIQESIDNYKNKIKLTLEEGINNIAIAGGFGPHELNTYFEVKNYFKINISIDAEKRLQANDTLDFNKVEAYIDELCSHAAMKSSASNNQAFSSGRMLQIKSNNSFDTI